MKLAERLKKLREERGFMQKFVADSIGVRSNTLSGYENGTRSPDPETLVKLASFYDVSTDYLLGKSDIPNHKYDDGFQSFLNDPELESWYRELPENDEEELRQMKEMWEVMKKYKHFD